MVNNMNIIKVEDIVKRLKENKFEFAFGTYKDKLDKDVYVVIEIENTDNISADNKIYMSIRDINLYLIQKYKEINEETKIEEYILKDIIWESEEFENEDEGIYIVKYSFAITELKGG